MVLGILIASIFGWNPWVLGIVGLIISGFPDTASWVMWKLSQFSWWKWKQWERWELYNKCHPVPDGGSWDKYCKWIPFWGQHTWLWDSIVHTEQPKFIFPQFDKEWKNIVWIEIWPSHWNIQFTKWDVMYVIVEFSLWILYTTILAFSV